jgi:endoglucanase
MFTRFLSFIIALGASSAVWAQADETIRLNQTGMYPQQEKTAVIETAKPGKISIRDAATGKTVLKAKVTRTSTSPWSGKKRAVVDFSRLTAPGQYILSVDGHEQPFYIKEHALRDLTVSAIKSYYLMRSGTAIEKQYAGEYARPLGHADTQVLVHPSAASESRPEGSVISSPLGWYDAGDYNKYVVNSAFSIGLMLGVYEENKAYFDRLQTNIPESKNQTADFLDEMMFNMLWLLTMQDPDDGGVYHKLTTPNFEGFVMPKDCHQPRYVVAKSVTATLDFAAVMAQMARLMKGNADYPDFSAKAAEAAERAYLWALVHPDAFYRQGDMNKQFQPAVNTGEYGDGNATDERFWAATELYKLTGKTVYKQDALRLMPSDFLVPSWGNVSGLGMLSWLSAGDAVQADKVRQALQACCDAYVKDTDLSCFQAPYGNHAHDFGWGHLSERCCGMGIALLFSDQYVAKGKYRRYALENIDCLLGRNALGYCYVTGFGQKSPMHPHHRPSAADGIDAPFPGMLVGGPNPGQQDKGSNLVYPSSLPDESYVDHADSYASNEIAINWNAALVGLLCWVDATE